MKTPFIMLVAVAVACVTVSAAAQATPAAPQQAAPAAGTPSINSKIAMCVGCHGIKGYQASFPEVYKVPMISGQSAKYIAAALTAYKNGERKHPTMRAIATTLGEADINEIAAYYEASAKADQTPMPEKLDKQPDAQVAALMQKAACASCHGPNLSKPVDPSYPRIAGQHPDYLFMALKAYKSDKNPSIGRSNGVMGAIAKQFSQAELKALARYVGSLDSQLRVEPESRFR